jgi:hypothetical protein
MLLIMAMGKITNETKIDKSKLPIKKQSGKTQVVHQVLNEIEKQKAIEAKYKEGVRIGQAVKDKKNGNTLKDQFRDYAFLKD